MKTIMPSEHAMLEALPATQTGLVEQGLGTRQSVCRAFRYFQTYGLVREVGREDTGRRPRIVWDLTAKGRKAVGQ